MASTYKSQIMQWRWNEIVAATQMDAAEHDDRDVNNMLGCDLDGHVGSCYLGSVFSLTPSGKFYMPWTTNQTADDVERDSRWYEAAEAVASKHGGSIESGEGDPTDLYFTHYWTNDELGLGRCDICDKQYHVADREDHCPEEGRCWEHCTNAEAHRV